MPCKTSCSRRTRRSVRRSELRRAPIMRPTMRPCRGNESSSTPRPTSADTPRLLILRRVSTAREIYRGGRTGARCR